MIRPSIQVSAPSNIALIKYMGKEPQGRNVACNPSVSMTLSGLSTALELVAIEEGTDPRFTWTPDRPSNAATGFEVPDLSEKSRARFLSRANELCLATRLLLEKFGIEREARKLSWEIHSANSFPSDSGIASSASSFAALSFGIFLSQARDESGAREAFETQSALRTELAHLAREGSGSAGRSFFGPWTFWDGDRLESVSSALPPMSDLVVLVSSAQKAVSSSQAHQLVRTSPLWKGRTERARARATELLEQLQEGNLNRIAELAWEESWEMHSLFHTASPPFTYWQPESLSVLQWANRWTGALAQNTSKPIVTMDAGPNVHILVPSSERALWLERIQSAFPQLQVLVDGEGRGPQ